MACGDLKLSTNDFNILKLNNETLKYYNTKYEKIGLKLCDHKCDVQFRVGRVNFRAHREVLSNASDYFRAMFSHGMIESQRKSIVLHDVCPQGFHSVLDYIYHGHITINPGSVEGIINASRFFQVEWMITVACDYLKQLLNPENFTYVLQMTEFYSLDQMSRDLLEYFAMNLETLSNRTSFHEGLSLEFLLNFLDSNLFMDTTEGFLLKVILDWLEKNSEYSLNSLLLLNSIRYGLLDIEELNSIPKYITRDHPEISRKVEAAKLYVQSVNSQCLQSGLDYRERGATSSLVVMTACEFSNGNRIIYRDLECDRFCYEEIVTDSLPLELEFTAQQTIGDFLFIAGGYEADYVSSDRLFRFDPKRRDWLELAPMTHARVSFAACSSQSALFVIGGISHIVQNDRDNEIILNSVECYDPAVNRWSSLPSLPWGCYSLAASYHHGKIYITGGITTDPSDSVPTDYVSSYEIGEYEWGALPSLPHSLFDHASVTVADQIFTIGGKTSAYIGDLSPNLFIQSYNILYSQWTVVYSIPSSICHILSDVAVYNNCIAFLSGPLQCRSLYVFDSEQKTVSLIQDCGAGFAKVCLLPVAFP